MLRLCRKDLIKAFTFNKVSKINEFIKLSTYPGFVSLKNIVSDLSNDTNSEKINDLLGKSITNKRLKKLEVSKKLCAFESQLLLEKINQENSREFFLILLPGGRMLIFR